MSASAPPALADLRMACLAQEAALQKLHAWLSGATATSVGEAEREALEIASLLAAARRQPALPQPHSVFAAPPLPPPAAAAVASASRAIEAALRKQAAAAGAVLRRVQPRAGKRAEHSPPLLPPNEIVRLLPHQSLLGVEEDQVGEMLR